MIIGRIPGLLGREEELASITAFLQRARKGAGGVLLIQGEPGIGKTRLIDETIARSEGWAVYRAVAEEMYLDRPFGLLADALDLTGRSGDPPRSRVMDMLSATAGEVAAGRDLRFVVAEEIVAMIENEALDVPVLLALEDLHWADPASMMTIHRLARQIDRLRVAVLVTYRPAPRPETLASFIDAQLEAGRLELQLAPLSPQDVSSLASDLLGADLGPNLVRHLERASGNPLFVLELLAGLVTEGVVEDHAGTKEVAPVPSPSSVHLAVLRRLRFLGEGSTQLLQIAAVLGESFTLDDLALVTGSSQLDCYQRLREAVTAGFISSEGDRLQFRHDVVREALYADLPFAVQRSMHVEIARALAAANGDLIDIAHHYSLGASTGDEEAVAWLLQGARSTAAMAPKTAVNLYERALELSDPGGPAHLDIRTEMVRPLLLDGDASRLKTVTEAVLTSGELSWEQESIVRSALSGLFVLQDQLPEAVAQVDAVLARQDLPPYQRAHFLAMGASRALLGELEAGIEMARDAISLGIELGATTSEASGHLTLANVALLKGDIAGSVGHAIQAIDAVKKTPRANPIRAGTIEMDRANVALFASSFFLAGDRWDEAAGALASARTGYESLGASVFLSWVHWGLAAMHFHMGEWDDALAELDAARLLGPQSGAGPRPVFGDPRCEINVRRGDLSAAAQATEKASATLPLSPGGAWIARARSMLLAARGDRSGALDVIQQAWDLPLAHGLSPDVRALGPALASLSVARDDGTLSRIRGIVETQSEDDAAPPSLRATSLVALGTIEQDPSCLLRAVQLARESARPVLLAECLEASAGVGEGSIHKDGVVAWLTEALELYEARQATRDVARVTGRLRSLGVRRGSRGKRSRPTHGWESLTPAELQVVGLLTEGLTNPQIGERLFISRRTVATHLSNAFRKLDVSSRAELAALAARAETSDAD